MVACCFLAAFVSLLNFEYIDIHLVSDICVAYVHVLHLPSPPGGPSAVSDGPKDCWQKSLIVQALGLTPKGTPKLGNCTRGLTYSDKYDSFRRNTMAEIINSQFKTMQHFRTSHFF